LHDFIEIMDNCGIIVLILFSLMLLLIDEAGSVNKSFFKEEDKSSVFEVLMNQLRTTSFIRTQIAIYPQSYSDILTEIRYGDAINLH
jgi:hypothetical protein